ncbi:Cytochrome c oxidase, subunit Vib family protein [Zostera marina]|uniref:Cytochrome c oxidase, subunit Vib family protein n=1 Tax=Zostera marina TaxID=29655 RepID=A0A0K9NQZ1_ZOSMR|nr:Cytochrome c oxidase, subunit Vib family protein [Zostera marina]
MESLEIQQSGAEKIYTDVLSDGRNSCYKARDAFYTCVETETAKGKKSIEVGSVGLLYPTDCQKARAEFVKQCRSTWVKHFDRQHCAKKKMQRLLEDENGTRRGPISMAQSSSSNSKP